MTTTAPKTSRNSLAAPDTPIGGTHGENWAAVAEALNRQMADCRITQQHLAARSGISVATIRVLQHGTGRRARDATLAALSRALGRPNEHLLRVLLGDQPPTVDALCSEAAVPRPRTGGPDPVLRLPASLADWWSLRYLTDSAPVDRVESRKADQLFAVVHLPSRGRPDAAVYVAFESAQAASIFALDHGFTNHLIAQLLFDITPATGHSTTRIRRHQAT